MNEMVRFHLLTMTEKKKKKPDLAFQTDHTNMEQQSRKEVIMSLYCNGQNRLPNFMSFLTHDQPNDSPPFLPFSVFTMLFRCCSALWFSVLLLPNCGQWMVFQPHSIHMSVCRAWWGGDEWNPLRSLLLATWTALPHLSPKGMGKVSPKVGGC